MLSIALKAEEEWGITIPAEEYGQCATVESMSRVVESLLEGPAASDKPRERIPVRPIVRFEDTPEYLHFLERQKALIGNGDNPASGFAAAICRARSWANVFTSAF